MRLLNQMFIWAAVSSVIWAQPLPSNATVFASGLNNPRGLIFGPNYKLFVSEAGTGGESTTIGECSQQVGFPLGPLRGGLTGRVSQISRDGQRETVTDALPSTKTSNITGQDVFGVTVRLPCALPSWSREIPGRPCAATEEGPRSSRCSSS